jgi:hypothetical protein
MFNRLQSNKIQSLTILNIVWSIITAICFAKLYMMSHSFTLNAIILGIVAGIELVFLSVSYLVIFKQDEKKFTLVLLFVNSYLFWINISYLSKLPVLWK